MTNRRWMIAALGLALALLAAAAPALGQQTAESMSAADRAIVTTRASEIAESATIYGYDLAAGGWSSTKAHCAALPDVILLQYRRTFPDGAQSRFTAVTPRTAGRVRIVPVLYHGATPFVPAATNPRNYALFNELVQQAGGGAQGRVRLSGCYAELTGGDAGPLPETRVDIAGAPGPTLHLEPESKTSSVTLASRATPDSYHVWSVSFDKKGRVTKATNVVQPANPFLPPTATPAEERAESKPAASTPVLDPGWKFIPQPPDPPSKFVPDAPDPTAKATPE